MKPHIHAILTSPEDYPAVGTSITYTCMGCGTVSEATQTVGRVPVFCIPCARKLQELIS